MRFCIKICVNFYTQTHIKLYTSLHKMSSDKRKNILDCALRIYPDNDFCTKFEKKLFEECENENDNYIKMSYEKLGELDFLVKNNPNEGVLTKKLQLLLKDITPDDKDSLWLSSTYNELKVKKEYSISIQLFDDNKLVKCEFPCRNKKCRSDQCFFYTEQTRSADEPATCYVCCAKCGKRYKFS